MAVGEQGVPIELVSHRMEFKQKYFLSDTIEFEDEEEGSSIEPKVKGHDLHLQLILNERAVEDLEIEMKTQKGT